MPLGFLAEEPLQKSPSSRQRREVKPKPAHAVKIIKVQRQHKAKGKANKRSLSDPESIADEVANNPG